MKNNKKISKSHKVANKNNNVEPKDSSRSLSLHMSYLFMATVAEGVRPAFLDVAEPANINLIDNSYDIMLSIRWMPEPAEEQPGWFKMTREEICLYYHDEKVQEWTSSFYHERPDYKQMQDFIVNFVNKKIEEVRNLGKDFNINIVWDSNMMDWLSGRFVGHYVFPISDI